MSGNSEEMLTVRRSTRRRAAVTAVTVILCGGLLTACSHGGSSKPDATTTTTTAQASVTGHAARSTHALTIGTVDIERGGNGGGIRIATRKAVLAAAQRYVDTAILAPLETGKLGRGYSASFAAGIRPAVTGPDEGILTDLSVGQTISLRQTSTPVAMSGLLDGFGTPIFIATNFAVNVQATKSTGPLTISRTLELTFEPVAGHWLITAYRASVRRAIPAKAPAPKKKATPTTVQPKRTTKKP